MWHCTRLAAVRSTCATPGRPWPTSAAAHASPQRDLIEALLDGGTRPPAIVRMLAARGISPPGKDSIRGHQQRHRASPAVMRRVSQGLELLDRHAEHLPPSDALLTAAGTPAVPLRIHA